MTQTENGFTITEHQYWQNTMRSVENAYCWLTTYETQNYPLVDEAIAAMRKLITHGKTIEQVKSYKSLSASSTPPTAKKSTFHNTPVNYNLEPNWKRVDDNTIHIDLGTGGGTAVAIAVTTEEQLDEMIKDIYSAPYIAVDCEFLAQKNSLPELKLLQVGVSKEKGYAVQVDKIGVDIMTDKLKPILENEELNVISWSFRSDALAIECYLKKVELAPVLDLQAKLKPIALDQLNLSAAMNKFASNWVGNNEFQKAKQYGTQFNFTGENCIWVCSPLPPKALVYAVFDVLSVIALHEATMSYDPSENHFWPYTITKVESRKAVDNWHRLRAKGINSTVGNQSVVKIVAPTSSPKPSCTPPESFSPNDYDKGKAKTSTPNIPIITTLGDGYDDENDQYKREMELAIEESKKDYIKQLTGHSGSSGPSGDRVVSSEDISYSDISYSDIANELDGTSSHNANTVFSKNIPKKPSNAPEIVPGSWGTEVLDDQPFIGTGKKFKIDNKDIDTSNTSVNTGSDSQANYSSNHNQNTFNVDSPTFVPQGKRFSTNRPSRHITNTTEKNVSSSTRQAEPSLAPTQPDTSLLSPKHNNQSLASPTMSSPVEPPRSAEKTDKVVSRWRTEPTEMSSQWGDQQFSPKQQASSNTANSSWRNDVSGESPAHWGDQVPSSENQVNTAWGDQTSTFENQVNTTYGDQTTTYRNQANSKWGDQISTSGDQANTTWGDQTTTSGNQVNTTWGSTVDNQSATADNQDNITWSENETQTADSHWGEEPSATENQDDNQWNGNNKKFTSSGWGGKSDNKSWQGKSGSWGDRQNRSTSGSYGDHRRNSSSHSHNQWRDTQSAQKTNTASYRSPATRASPRTANASLSNQASPNWNSKGFPSSIKSSSLKPEKAKYTTELKNRITMGNQGGSFTTYQTTGNEMSSASWKSFANSTIQNWEVMRKDTPLDAINKPVHPSTSTTQSEPIRFNTVAHSNYPRGGDIGDSSTGRMHGTEDHDAWKQDENRPDTMEMPMNQIPVPKEFSGPRIQNPDDEGDSDDSEDYSDDYDDVDFPGLKMGSMQEIPKPQKSQVQRLKTYVDSEYLYGENRDVALLRLDAPEHLDMINIPPPGTDYTVTIGYHFAMVKDKNSLKAIQLYLSTGESYTMIIEKCCYVKDFENIKHTKFGRLVRDPNIKRICWYPQIIEREMMEKVGFVIGPCVDLAFRANYDNSDDEDMTLGEAIAYYLKGWEDKSHYDEAKKDYDSLNSKKFSSSCWDRDSLPAAVLRYSAIQGLIVHALYLETLKKIDVSDDQFIYHC